MYDRNCNSNRRIYYMYSVYEVLICIRLFASMKCVTDRDSYKYLEVSHVRIFFRNYELSLAEKNRIGWNWKYHSECPIIQGNETIPSCRIKSIHQVSIAHLRRTTAYITKIYILFHIILCNQFSSSTNFETGHAIMPCDGIQR